MRLNERAEHTVELIRARRHSLLHEPKRRKLRIPARLPPTAIEKEYYKAIMQVVEMVKSVLRPVLDDIRLLLPHANAQRARMDSDEAKQAQKLIEDAAKRVRDRLHPADLDDLAHRFAHRTSSHNREQLAKQTRAALGVDIYYQDRKAATLIDGFVAENISLIKDVPEHVLSEVEKATTRAFASGTLYTDLADEIQDQFGFAESRAKLIARDQIGKLNAQLSQARNQELGVTRYIWRTMNDDRVRDEHEEREGETFDYDDPPDGGAPGEDILCRCYDEPVFDDILDEAESED